MKKVVSLISGISIALQTTALPMFAMDNNSNNNFSNVLKNNGTHVTQQDNEFIANLICNIKKNSNLTIRNEAIYSVFYEPFFILELWSSRCWDFDDFMCLIGATRHLLNTEFPIEKLKIDCGKDFMETLKRVLIKVYDFVKDKNCI